MRGGEAYVSHGCIPSSRLPLLSKYLWNMRNEVS